MAVKQHTQILCQNICYLRKRHGLTKSRMAAIMGIGVKSLTMLENGSIPKRLGCDVLWNISRYFHVSIKDLFLPMEDEI